MNLSWGRKGKPSNAKLNEAKVLSIKAQLRAGVPCEMLATQFKVSKMTIRRIDRGETWAHVKL